MNRLAPTIASLAALTLLASACGEPDIATADGLLKALTQEGLCADNRGVPGSDDGLFADSNPVKPRFATTFYCQDTYIGGAGFATANDREEAARWIQSVDKEGYTYAGTGDNLWVMFMNPQYADRVTEMTSGGIRSLHQG